MSVISVSNLSKSYRLGTIGGGTLKGDISRWWAKFRGRPDPLLKVGQEHQAQLIGQEFLALQDVSFTVQQGEILGIIGRNGAGKSTLLKILSRVTAPTRGEVRVKGRIASLLEVGTGFHPELTGRENIFLNGAILGMTKAEIRQKFDEIVAFSGVDEFIDTPVKRYSSGMYVRLAFAVAAHLEPEILIVDEVLAVGDAEFQQKCLGKMKDVATGGRTVLFVSHNMPAVQRLCSRLVLLQAGTITRIGNPTDLITEYLGENHSLAASWTRPSAAGPATHPEILQISILNSKGAVTPQIYADESFAVRICLRAEKCYDSLQIAIRFTNQNEIPVFSTCNTDETRAFVPINAGLHEFVVKIPANFLAPGKYKLIVAAHVPQVAVLDVVEEKLSVSVSTIGSLSALLGDGRLGVIEPVLTWIHSIK